MSRIRTNGEIKVNPGAVGGFTSLQVKRVISGGRWHQVFQEVAYSGGSRYKLDNRETMSDVVGYRERYNALSHVKKYPVGISLLIGDTCCPSIPGPATYPPEPNTWVQYGMKDTHVNSQPLSFHGHRSDGSYILSMPAFPAADWSSLVSEVGSQLSGRMVTGQNLLVDLAQVGQTVGMFTHPFKSVVQLLRGKVPPTLRNLAKASAGSYLEYKFGWENIYRSIKQLHDVWGEVRTHQKYLDESIDRFVPLAARQREEVTISSQPPFYNLATTGVVCKPVLTRAVCTYCFSINLRRTVADSCWSKLDQVLSRLGIHSVVEALWDCVPYSFVVDWFTHANRYLTRSHADFGSRELRRVGYSTKIELYGRVDTTLTSLGYGGASKVTHSSGSESLVQTSYVRTPGFPPGTSTIGFFGSLNKTQLAEGLSLIVQRL